NVMSYNSAKVFGKALTIFKSITWSSRSARAWTATAAACSQDSNKANLSTIGIDRTQLGNGACCYINRTKLIDTATYICSHIQCSGIGIKIGVLGKVYVNTQWTNQCSGTG